MAQKAQPTKTEYDDVSELLYRIKQSERLSKDEITQLSNLTIQLRHQVPPQHQIESCAGTHTPKPEEVERFKRITTLVKGSFSPSEDNIIVENWKAFCKLHNWNNRKYKPFLYLRNETKCYIRRQRSRREFVQFLADGLPNRTLYSVYHRFRNLYSNHIVGRFKEEEDEIILNHIEQNPNVDMSRKYADLAKVLNRTRQSIYRRYKILTYRRFKREND